MDGDFKLRVNIAGSAGETLHEHMHQTPRPAKNKMQWEDPDQVFKRENWCDSLFVDAQVE